MTLDHLPPAARLPLRLHRLELVALAAVATALVAGALVVAAQLDGLGVPTACFLPTPDPSAAPPTGLDCRGVNAFWDMAGISTSSLRPLAAVFPFLVGLFLGVPLVGRELETGTARLAWSLSPSRTRWLLGRLGPLALVTLALLVPVALSMDRLEAASNPAVDPWRSFSDSAQRGLTMIGWGMAVLGIGTLAGAVLGRQLPALMVAGLVCVAAWIVVDEGTTRWMSAEAVPLSSQSDMLGARWLDMRFRDLATGELLTATEFASHVPPEYRTDGDWQAAHFQSISFGIPGSRYREVDVVIGGIAVAIGAASLRAAAAVVSRRRP